MQELPELEIYRALLAERFAGAAITALECLTGEPSEEDHILQDNIVGKYVWFVERRADLVVFHLDNGKRLTIRLADDAALFVESSNETMGETVSIRLRFGDRSLALSGVTTSDFSLVSVKELEAQMKGRGIDPFDKRLTLSRFIERYAKKRSTIKTALLDQNLIVGVGPVYADEILFEAKIRPERKLNEMIPADWEQLYHAMGHILRDAISHGGVKVQPLFSGDSFTGGYRDRLAVHGLDGQLCRRCGGTIKKTSVAGRKNYRCPDCQL
ncbi:Fpg/Nei family DNA glycosylase [Paenibacillus sp. strain BS8-2]